MRHISKKIVAAHYFNIYGDIDGNAREVVPSHILLRSLVLSFANEKRFSCVKVVELKRMTAKILQTLFGHAWLHGKALSGVYLIDMQFHIVNLTRNG